jgi:hypothetical protein
MRVRQVRAEAAGFEPTGDHQPLPSRAELTESKLRRKL